MLFYYGQGLAGEAWVRLEPAQLFIIVHYHFIILDWKVLTLLTPEVLNLPKALENLQWMATEEQCCDPRFLFTDPNLS
jgi:hypothetical protein